MSTGVLNHPPSNSQRENKAVPPVFFHHPRARFYRENEILPGRSTPLETPLPHFLNHRSLLPPFPPQLELAIFGLGCFWGAERVFWDLPGIYLTAVGFAGGQTSFPTYTEVCSGKTNHTEVVQLVFDPSVCTYESLLKLFWESHDPTQGMRQGKDYGTQYRSLIGTTTKDQHQQAFASRHLYTLALFSQGFDEISTEIIHEPLFYLAENYHQQYLAKNPHSYCELQGTGVTYPLVPVVKDLPISQDLINLPQISSVYS